MTNERCHACDGHTDTRTVESRAVFCLSRIRNSQIQAMTSPPPNPGNAQKKPFFLQETVAEYEVAGSLPPAAFFSYQPPLYLLLRCCIRCIELARRTAVHLAVAFFVNCLQPPWYLVVENFSPLPSPLQEFLLCST